MVVDEASCLATRTTGEANRDLFWLVKRTSQEVGSVETALMGGEEEEEEEEKVSSRALPF